MKEETINKYLEDFYENIVHATSAPVGKAYMVTLIKAVDNHVRLALVDAIVGEDNTSNDSVISKILSLQI